MNCTRIRNLTHKNVLLKKILRRTLTFILGMGVSRPDKRRSTVCKLYFQFVVSAINQQLNATLGERYESLRPTMWGALDEEIGLQDCDIYR